MTVNKKPVTNKKTSQNSLECSHANFNLTKTQNPKIFGTSRKENDKRRARKMIPEGSEKSRSDNQGSSWHTTANVFRRFLYY